MIPSIEEAQHELSETVQAVALDMGEDAAEASYSDLVHSVAGRCTPEVAKELLRRELG